MKTKIIALLVAVILPFVATAQIDRSVQPKPGPMPKVKFGKVDKFTLSNGLRVIMVANHKLPSVTVSLSIDNKPVAETSKAGLSNLMGGLLGTGTTHISKDDFNETVDYLGANISFNSDGASLRSLKRYFPKVLHLMADGVKNPVFTQTEFDKVVKLTLESLKSNENNVSSIASRVGNALIYGKNHPFGEFATPKTIKNITLAEVKSNYNTYYRPNNAYLVVVGDINPSKTKKLITKNFFHWKRGNIPATELVKPKNIAQTEIDFINMPNAVQSRIDVVNNINLKLGDKDYFAASLANYILGGGATARLFKNLREDKAYTYGAYSRLTQSRYAGVFKAGTSVRNMVTDSSVVQIRKEIHRIRKEKVSEEELKNAKAAYIGSFVMNIEKPSTTARYALNMAMYNLPEDFYKNYLDRIDTVTAQDIQKVANTYFKENQQRIIIAGKGADILKNLEKTTHYKINYFDKQADAVQKPVTAVAIPAGVTVATVIDNYFKAIGGKAKVIKIKTVQSDYKAMIQGMEMDLTIKKATPNKQTVIVSSMGSVMQKNVFDGVKGYREVQGNRVNITGKELSTMKAQTTPFPEVAYKKGILKRIEPLNGKNAYVVVYGDTENFYDVNSGLKMKTIQTVKGPRGTMKITLQYADYKQIDGVKFPHTIIQAMGPVKMDFKATAIKVNQGITDKDFK